jgi:hypothetical protein
MASFRRIVNKWGPQSWPGERIHKIRPAPFGAACQDSQ